MTLRDVLARLAAAAPNAADGGARPGASLDAPVTGIAYDSRHAVAGTVFVALRGQRADGGTFARQALGAGAMLVVSESSAPPDLASRWLVVPDARAALSLLAAEFYARPSEELLVIGITGTNGKTTTSYLLASIFEQAGIRCGRLGTVSYLTGAEERAAARTTPEAPDLQRLLREMVTQGCGACAMEVSSHALALRRVDDVRFSAAVFTNLTRDHLDFHADMESYFLAKQRLFELLPSSGMGVINVDDPRSAALAATVTRSVTYALVRPADVRPATLSFSLAGLTCEVQTPRGLVHLRSPLLGKPNAYNVLAAVSVAMALDVSFAAIEKGVAALDYVPGRFQVVSDPRDEVAVVVDYAHTDDALKNLLETARPLARGRVITVFGCGGDRDATKRPLMGAVAARLSDLIIVTSDNPRSEDPARIIEDVMRGIVPPKDRSGRASPSPRLPACHAIVDRSEAIERAVREASPGDLVLIAGKGHETYQEIGDRMIPFNDVEIARAALARRRASSRVG